MEKETSFKSSEFRKNAEYIGIELQASGIEAQNFIVQGERYQIPLQRFLNIVQETNPQLDDNATL